MSKASPRPKRRVDSVIPGLIAAAGVLICAGFSYFRWLLQSGIPSGMFSGMCGNDVYQEVLSPNGQYKMVVFERDCGATTGFSTQVSILGAAQELSNISGNIVVIDDHPDYTNVQVEWESNQRVNITYVDGYEVNYRQEIFRDASRVFKIKYTVVSNE